jgi:hypothetical protein
VWRRIVFGFGGTMVLLWLGFHKIVASMATLSFWLH